MSGFTRLDFAALDAAAARFDAAVDSTPEVDHFCSSTGWILPARRAFHAEAQPLVLELDSGFAALMVVHTERLGRAAFPLEATWGMASPVIGRDPASAVRDTVAALTDLQDEWDTLDLLGLRHKGAAMNELIRCYAGRRRLGQSPPTSRCAASLAGGYDGFLSRRSAKFRSNARRTLKRVHDAGVRFERLVPSGRSSALTAFDRVVEVERRSWKGRAGHGIDRGRMNTFYRDMFPRLARRGSLRAGFLTRDGKDLAFICGGVHDGAYRGLQVSFDDEDGRELALGNAAQLHLIRSLCDEGVQTYDLGQDMPYKRKWGESVVESIALVVL